MDADQLYGLPLDRFIPERTALVRALRTEGRREEANTVSQLRKPSVAAWAVNQLARTQRQTLGELLDAGDRLREAHENVISGRGDGRALRTALERERAAVGTLLKAAHGLLSSEGHELSATTVERVSDTLHAAALEQDAHEAVCEGRLERELRHVGLGPVPAHDAPRPRGTKRRSVAKKGTPRDQEADVAKARKAAAGAEAQARRLAERAARRLELAEKRRGSAAQTLEEAQRALEEAKESLTTARAEAKSATEAHSRTRATLDALANR